MIELLVVVGIIALLLSLLLPALSRARAAARQIKCASQLKQIDHGLQMYANDWKGAVYPAYPGSFHAWWEVTPGLESSYARTHGPFVVDIEVFIRCPEDNDRPDFVEGVGYRNSSQFSYVFNGHLETAGIRRNSGTAYEIAASNIVVMGESREGENAQYLRAGFYDRMIDPRKHHEGSNYLWLDGHVSRREPWNALVGAVDPWDIPTVLPTQHREGLQ